VRGKLSVVSGRLPVKGLCMVVDPVIAALREQVECYARLAKLAELQHEHVQQGRTEALLDVLGLRQEVLDQIGGLERVIAGAKRGWAEYLRGLRSEQRTMAERLLAETRRLLEQITAADMSDCLVLQQRKMNLGKEIGQTTAAKAVNRNYAVAAYGVKVARMDVRQ
jgi:hypothetical protein